MENNYISARGDINLWDPLVEFYDESNSAQISLKSGFVEIFERIEASWMVYPNLFNSGGEPRLFYTFGHWMDTDIQEKASIVAWGGDVYSKNVKPGHAYHTTAYMAASELFGSANYITNIRIIDESLQLKYPDPAFVVVDEPNCYSALIHKADPNSEPYFYFGGHPDYNCVYNQKYLMKRKMIS
ncbi:hypothetical protein SO802_004636 [Lithocarpus litseifolius]|uniref:Neprosin PEP catalytic domain-containing protein n=1 Tax=Lithocarpus litseifolius TaxID=425828 RepID=A0AAW2E685_9ROSI